MYRPVKNKFFVILVSNLVCGIFRPIDLGHLNFLGIGSYLLAFRGPITSYQKSDLRFGSDSVSTPSRCFRNLCNCLGMVLSLMLIVVFPIRTIHSEKNTIRTSQSEIAPIRNHKSEVCKDTSGFSNQKTAKMDQNLKIRNILIRNLLIYQTGIS